MNEPSQERADPSARSLGSLFCNIHFVSNSIKLRQLYVTEFATDENQFFQPIKYELGKVLCMFLCLSRCVFHWGFLRPTLEFRFFIFFFDFLFPQSRLLSRSSWVTMNRFFPINPYLKSTPMSVHVLICRVPCLKIPPSSASRSTSPFEERSR